MEFFIPSASGKSHKTDLYLQQVHKPEKADFFIKRVKLPRTDYLIRKVDRNEAEEFYKIVNTRDKANLVLEEFTLDVEEGPETRSEFVVKLRDKAQLTIPKEVRENLKIREGDLLLCEELSDGSIKLTPTRMMKGLQAAPEGKSWDAEIQRGRQEIAAGRGTKSQSLSDLKRSLSQLRSSLPQSEQAGPDPGDDSIMRIGAFITVLQTFEERLSRLEQRSSEKT